MSVAASLLSIALFIAFATTGLQKVVFNPASSRAAEHLGYAKRTYQRVGVIEVVGAIALMVGLAARRSAPLGLVNEVGAGVLVVLAGVLVVMQRRHGDRFAQYAPNLVLGVLALAALLTRAL